MDITVSQEQGRVSVSILHLEGSLDSDSYKEFQFECEKLIAAGERYLLVDMSGVNYMSSAGLRSLKYIYDLLRSKTDGTPKSQKDSRSSSYKSSQIKLLSPTHQILEVIKMTGFDMLFEIHNNLTDAVASF